MLGQQKSKAEENIQTRHIAVPISWKMFWLKIFTCYQTKQHPSTCQFLSKRNDMS